MAHPKRNKSAWKYQVADRGSLTVKVLEAAWDMLRHLELGIPAAVLTLVGPRSRRSVRGYFAGSTWKLRGGTAHEVAISPQLIRDPEGLLGTMLHEAAHAILFESGQNGGIGSTRYYHTKVFRDQCLTLGLRCAFLNNRYGWSVTDWPTSGVPSRYRKVLAFLRRRLPAGVGGRVPRKSKGRRLPKSGHTRLRCSCEPTARTIYVSKSTLQAAGVVCAYCGEEFKK